MSYRVERSKTNRAGCRAPHCKDAGIKIDKDDLRQGVLVTIKEHTSWMWRHWGCVTPEIIRNWKTSSDGDMDMVDGYEDLPSDLQEKVQRAFEQGHVDDADWGGDLEMNRWTGKRQGMFVKVKTPSKKAKKNDGDDEDEAEAEPFNTPAKVNGTTKKRGKVDDDEANGEDEVKPKTKKPRTKKAKDVDDEANGEDEVKPKTKKPRTKKAAKVEAEDDEPAPPVKKASRSAKAKRDEADDDHAAPKPATRKGRGRKAKSAETVEDDDDHTQDSAPAVMATSEKNVVDDDLGSEPEAEKPKPQKRKAKGRGKKAAAIEED
ncbi:hypothetical protein LTR91_014701 [Friedmanniomyces endolithicus]|uniref:PARP-type domain-containing protein n=2 Tax=Dothideomycetidae TaxID=451867 RepID=A0AAN6KB84_9PEZI|nr:hypothetical protein LTS09_003134 [Friedmanniomyces endolithicus]KAK5142114.1 hypothetical protein LTR32_005472 [Rachicladosporium monterosium]KAK0867339.1 hypothetical protein LTS02_004288 [Friedmanniomyces endolithicus]KAK0870184.1 hypothetical protein LTR87_013392 [Friedmanniomyces endolithicus]KAK0908443.1 hypothetical protein LTR57_016812 [Friedmanniomyces endolithicus]